MRGAIRSRRSTLRNQDIPLDRLTLTCQIPGLGHEFTRSSVCEDASSNATRCRCEELHQWKREGDSGDESWRHRPSMRANIRH